MNASQDLIVALTACAFGITGAFLSCLSIAKARSSTLAIRYLWIIVSGGLLGGTVWLFQIQSLLSLSDVEFHHFGMANMYGTFVRTVILCVAAVTLASLRRKSLDVAAGVIFAFALLYNHIDNIAAVIPDVENVFGSPFAFPMAVFVALCSGISAFILRQKSSSIFVLLPSFFLAIAIIVPHEIGILGISWDESVIGGPQDITVTPNFMFTTMLVFGGMMLVAVGSVLLLDRQHVSDRVQELERLAFLDPVTGLNNRAKLQSWLSSDFVPLSRSVALVIGSSSYRDVIDVYGHEAADTIVKELARSLRGCLVTSSFLARTSDRRFILIAPSMNEMSDKSIASKVLASISGEVTWEDMTFSPGAYMGVAAWLPARDTSKDFLVRADLAAGRAWRSGAARPVHYKSEIDEPNRHRSSLSIDMRQALKKKQFKLAFQRQNLICTGDVVGYEVLLRWAHPTKGLVSPEVFIPLAERDGLIDEIGEWVLMEACREASRWTIPKKIAVNVAPRQLADSGFTDKVRRALESSGLHPSLLEVELTESSVISDLGQALKVASELAQIGVSISMDDYGTGYSSLSTLQSFPFSKVKIDKAFISRLKTDPQAEAIVRSTLELCRKLDLDVVAEGVETDEQRALLEEMGCMIAQGYLYGEPMMATAMRGF